MYKINKKKEIYLDSNILWHIVKLTAQIEIAARLIVKLTANNWSHSSRMLQCERILKLQTWLRRSAVI